MAARVGVQLHPEWRVIVDLLRTRAYGALVTHVELAAATGLTYGTELYYRQVNRARKPLLVEWARELATHPTVGYRLVEPHEFHGRGRLYVGRAGKLLRRGARTIAAAPQHLLTDEQNARNADTLAKFGAIEAMRQRIVTETAPARPTRKADYPPLLT